ncbi:AraC family transcriptional regulator [Paraburkholderia sp. GAS32]|uniref:AraC family transcriptional regulator n=1 Tax=Paraburkholderia sp. GAS32 TaxID=3035129 RepID=UPI003D1D09D7
MGNLEKSCTFERRDWVRVGQSRAGIERIEAFFSGHAYELHRHDTYAMGVTLHGVQCFDYRGSRADSVPGNVMIIHPDEPHNGRAGTEAGFLYRMMYLEPRLVLDALEDRQGHLPVIRKAVLDDSRIRIALTTALSDLDSRLEDLQTDQLMISLAETLASYDRSVRKRPVTATCKVAVNRARELLDARWSEVVSSEMLEDATGLDRYTVARHFRSLCGTSPYRYLVSRRLGEARAMIADGEPLMATAIRCGFSDQSHMNRQFKNAFGVTPGQWRALSYKRRTVEPH